MQFLSLVYRIDYTIRYISSIHWSDTRYVSYQLFNNKCSEDSKTFPLAFGAGQFIDNTFSADNLTFTMSRQLWHMALMAVTKELVSDSAPKLSLSLWSELYIHIITLPEDGEPAYQIYVGRWPTNVGPLYRHHKKLNSSLDPGPGWGRSQVGLSVTVSASAAATFQLPIFFSRNWAARGRYWKHLLALFFILPGISGW